MKRYGKQNSWDDGDTVANCMNARKSSVHRSDGKGALRSSDQKHRLRKIMKSRTRLILKRNLCAQLKNVLL